MRWHPAAPRTYKRGERRIRSGFLLFPKMINGSRRWLEHGEWEEEKGPHPDLVPLLHIREYPYWQAIRWTDQEAIKLFEFKRPTKPPPPPPPKTKALGLTHIAVEFGDERYEGHAGMEMLKEKIRNTGITIEEFRRKVQHPKPADQSAYQGAPMEGQNISKRPEITPAQKQVFGDCPICEVKHGQRCMLDDKTPMNYEMGMHAHRVNKANEWIEQARDEDVALRIAEIPKESLLSPSPITIAESRLGDLEKFHLPENHAFWSVYRTLSPEEAALSRAIKDQAYVLLQLLELVPKGRDQSLAKTALEDSVMRGIRAITQ